MTGTAKVKPPKNDAEWARNTQKRIEQVEHPSSARIGAWVLSTDPETGDLIASNVNGGAVTLAGQPEGGAADQVESSGWSHLKVSRRTPQSVPSSVHTPIEWDTVDASSDGWDVAEGSSSLVFPEAGVWLMTYNLRFGATSTVNAVARIYLDGTAVLSDRYQPFQVASEPVLLCSSTFSVSAGTELYCTAWLGGAANTAGPSTVAPSDVTSLSLTRLPIGQ